MAKVLEKLSQLISQAPIPPEDQNDLLIILPTLPKKAIEDLVDIFSKNPKLIIEFNENFKAKLNVLINGRDNWEKLIEKEEEELKNENLDDNI
ncbi:hypothetical protein J7K86_00995 [bacterium]|nr:hypothetical protein [bacterium]